MKAIFAPSRSWDPRKAVLNSLQTLKGCAAVGTQSMSVFIGISVKRTPASPDLIVDNEPIDPYDSRKISKYGLRNLRVSLP